MNAVRRAGGRRTRPWCRRRCAERLPRRPTAPGKRRPGARAPRGRRGLRGRRRSHLTGKLAVCAGSCGPGNLHLIDGLSDCQRGGVPVLAIATHIPSTEIGIDYFQATHPESLFKECSHYVELVSNVALQPLAASAR